MADRGFTGETTHKLLSVVVPVFNERNTVAEILRRMRGVDLPLDLEILVVDDGSTDGTGKVLAALEDSTVRVLAHAANQGKGAALRTALAAARGDLVLIQDADLEYDPGDWPRLLAPVLRGRATVVYGSRFLGEGEAMSLRRWLGDRALGAVTSLLYNTTVSDVLTCFKLFDRTVLDGLAIEADRFDIEAELTAKLLRAGHRIYEVPVSYSGRDRAAGRKFTAADNLAAVRTLVRLRFRRP